MRANLLLGVLIILAVETGYAGSASAQVRGLPVPHESAFSYGTRVSVDVGHGGEAKAFTIVASASHPLRIGNCERLAFSIASGYFDSSIDAASGGLSIAGLGSVLLNPCRRSTSVANPAIRLFAGFGSVHVGNRQLADAPLGVSAGYMLPIAVARVEIWVSPRAQYYEALKMGASSDWRFALSSGVNVGVAGAADIRFALDCCEAIGFGYGLSLWF